MTTPKLERERVEVNKLVFYLLLADGVFVRSFQYSWECSGYCLLRWGILPTVKV